MDITPTSESNRDLTYKEKIEKKIREQAQRLIDLQTYKNLCEQRILQLMPNHSLPVIPAHLHECAKDDSNELNTLNKIIEEKDEVLFN